MDNLKLNLQELNLQGLSPEKRKLLEIFLKEQGLAQTASPDEIGTYERTDSLPLSYAEKRLWFFEKLDPGSPLYVIPMGIRLYGALFTETFEAALNEILRRHEIFRTNYKETDGKLVRIIHTERPIKLEQEDLSIYNAKDKKRIVKEIISRQSKAGFNLTEDPLLRAVLIKEREDIHVLLLIMHHIVSDNWSTGILMHELIEIYNSFVKGVKPNLNEIKVQYADYACWQNEFLSEKVIERQLGFWKEYLKDCPEKLEIFTDRIKSKSNSSAGTFEIFNVPQILKSKLSNLCKKEDVTLFMMLITAFEVLLYRYSIQYDFNIGYPIANRNHSGIENTIGFFVNTLVLRSGLKNGLSFREILKNNKTSILESFDNQDIPFEMLVEKLKLQGEKDINPLFQVMFVLNNAPMEFRQLEGLSFEVIDIDNGTSKFDLILSMAENNDGLKCKLEFNSNIFSREIIQQMSWHFRNLLNSVTEDSDCPIDKIQLMEKPELEKLLAWAGKIEKSPANTAAKTLHNLFEIQVLRSSEKTAVICENKSLSYGELNKRANRLARYLIRRGIGHEDTVGVYMTRSIASILSCLAIMKAGGVYVPLDVNYPFERLKYIADDSEIKVIISNEDLKDNLKDLEIYKLYLDSDWSFIEQEDSENLEQNIFPESLAYIIYTSGSTGRPKGVMIEHRAVSEHMLKIIKQYNISEDDNVLQFASLVFDASIEQIFSALITGAKLVMRGEDIWPLQDFSEKIKQYDLTVINPPTIYWQQLAYEWWQSQSSINTERVKLVIAGGDTMSKAALDKWQQLNLKNARLLNAYGPTETTITATVFEVTEGFSDTNRKVPIGKPVIGRKAYILDKNFELSPIGIAGELYIGGINLARGYKNQPQLTSERFIPDKFSSDPNSRLYKTGDLARWLPQGDIEFLGRSDEQVKLRGFRIETGEIEHTLKQYPNVKDAIVLVKTMENGDKKLSAFLSCEDIENSSLKLKPWELRSFLGNNLPSYMIPSEYIMIEEFPILPGGKVDKKALLELKTEPLEVQREYVAPRSDIERKLSAIFSEFLHLDKVGIFDNFFDLGGHSMLAMQVTSKISEQFQLEVPLKLFFEKPNVNDLALEIVKMQAEDIDQDTLRQLLNEIASKS
ncbi:MAG: amino acid adenylation domain-containing protein [Bacteroidota bacterium]|nr:amino acid adenylation domain-containing protein [Bacteroidota bacterium]